MKLLVVQLSDIHIVDEEDLVLGRADAIARALAATSTDVEACVLACSGDVAHSGKPLQYELAAKLFDSIRERYLQQRQDVRYFETFIPGNHDCELPKQGRSRSVLIDDVLKNPPSTKDVDSSLIKDCAKVQQSFFEFAASRVDPGSSTITNVPSLQYTYSLMIGSERLSILCLNSSWLSQIHEIPGQLLVDAWTTWPKFSDSALIIAMVHHPLHWLQPENAREVRNRLDKNCDIILTGHEHFPEHHLKRLPTGEELTYFAGGVLQEKPDLTDSSFYAFIVDLGRKEYLSTVYMWQDDMYMRESQTDWVPFHRNEARETTRLALTHQFLEVLEDCGAGYSHPRKATPNLTDLYVYPDIEDQSLRDRSSVPRVRHIAGEQVPLYIRTHNFVVLFGREKSGKTSLAKMLYRDSMNHGKFPLFLQGGQLRATDEKSLRKTLARAVGEQYGSAAEDRYFQLDKSKRILIIDDLDRSPLNYDGLNEFVLLAKVYFEGIVLLADDSFSLMEMSRSVEEQRELLTFRRCHIQAFGHQRRADLIEKWVTLGREFEIDDAALERTISDTEDLITTLIGSNLLPSSPLFVLTILQLSEGNTPHNTALGAYGYHYEALITASLSRALEDVEGAITMDTVYTVAGTLAFEMLVRKRRFLTNEEVSEGFARYKLEYSMRYSDEKMLAVLESGRLLHKQYDGKFVFQYKYIYYFFVAKYLASNLFSAKRSEDVRLVLEHMAKRTYVEDYSNILILFVYLTKDERTISAILNHSKELFGGVSCTDLNEDLAFTKRLQGRPMKFELRDETVKENRRKHREALDALKRGNGADEDDDLYLHEEEEALGAAVHVNESFKMIQILGQILCNFPGALPGDVKLEIATETYQLGLRLLKWAYAGVEEHLEELRQFLSELIKETRGIEDESELGRHADSLLLQMIAGSSDGVVRRIARAAGSVHLADTYKLVPGRGHEIPVDLIDLAIKLDQNRHFPEDSVKELHKRTEKLSFAADLLRGLVRDHFHMYSEPHKLRQRVCAMLGIQSQEPRMLGSAAKQRR